MLCPEVSSFPPPKTYSLIKKDLSLEKVVNIVKMNNFYKSAIITCPDELNIPNFIQETFEDSDYYQILNLSLLEFIDPVFIETFIKNGCVYCLSVNRKCISQHCAAITPDGILTLHIIENIYQTVGLQGNKRPNNFYEITLDLKNLKHLDKLKLALGKLDVIDFHLSWIPQEQNICPSTIAKYFCDKNYSVTQHSLKIEKLNPSINEVPSLCNIDIDEVVEWLGMLIHGADLYPKDNYTSTYYVPESASPLQTSKLSILVIKGFITPNILTNTCRSLSDHVSAREIDNYWSEISLQSEEESLYQWHLGSPRMFQSHNSSSNIFFTHNDQILYSIGQIKYT